MGNYTGAFKTHSHAALLVGFCFHEQYPPEGGYTGSARNLDEGKQFASHELLIWQTEIYSAIGDVIDPCMYLEVFSHCCFTMNIDLKIAIHSNLVASLENAI